LLGEVLQFGFLHLSVLEEGSNAEKHKDSADVDVELVRNLSSDAVGNLLDQNHFVGEMASEH
jgi:hypothetical protein